MATNAPCTTQATRSSEPDVNTNLGMCLVMLDGLILGIEAQSEIQVQLSELKTLALLIQREVNSKHNPCAELVIKAHLPQQLTTQPMPLYPTMDSLNSVLDLAYSQLPEVHPNKLASLMVTYHNTLLAQLKKEKP